MEVAGLMPARKYWFCGANVYCLCDWVSLHSVSCVTCQSSYLWKCINSYPCSTTQAVPAVCDQFRQKDVRAFHHCASQTRTNAFPIEKRFDRCYRCCLERRQCVYKCHYLAGMSAYCTHWGLLAARKGEVGGVYQPVWWTTKWIEWRMWWREREMEKWARNPHTHVHRREGETEVFGGK